MNSTTAKNTLQQGFTLVEVAIIVVVVSVVIGYMLSFYMTDKNNAAAAVTRQRVERVLDATASFVIDNNRLPFATMRVDGAEENATVRRGIVPYRTLGLSREDILDGFGNPLTFIIAQAGTTALASPVQINTGDTYNARYSTGSAANDTFQNSSGTVYRAYAPVKAVDDRRSNFCYDAYPDPVTRASRSTYYGERDPRYNPADASYVNYPNAITVNNVDAGGAVIRVLTRSAFVAVISHGENGSGGYRFPAGAGVNVNQFLLGVRGAAEVTNSAGSTRVDIGEYNQRDVNHFDDEVSYLTGQQLVSRTGSTTCHDYYQMCDCQNICISWQNMPQSNMDYNTMIENFANNVCPANQAVAADPTVVGDRSACACCARYVDVTQPSCTYKSVP